MGWRYILLNFGGRISRRKFWLGMLGLTLFQIVSFIVIVFSYVALGEMLYPHWSDTLHTMEIVAAELPALALWYCIGLWPTLAITTKRWHDRNKSGWWNLMLPPVSLPLLAFSTLLIPGLISNFEPGAGQPSVVARIFGFIAGAIYWISFGWTLIECGFLSGTGGTNRFGEDPLA